MAKYQTGNDLGGTKQSLSSSYKTLVSVFATTDDLRRVRVYDIIMGTVGTPGDTVVEWDVSRMTADGTATTVTPTPLDSADGVAYATSKANYTSEGTITAASSLFYVPVNQRASFRWVAAPSGELIVPATANAGLVVRAQSASYTGTAGAKMHFEE